MPPVLSSKVPMSPELREFVEKERDCPQSEVVLFKVMVKDSLLVLDSFVNGTAPATITNLKEAIDAKASAFYMLRQDTKRWCLVAYVPDSGITARVRMQYALSRSDLKNEFGPEFVLSEYHFTSLSDLSISGNALARALGSTPSSSTSNVSSVTGKMRFLSMPETERRSLLSKTEIAREEAHAMENEARNEMTSALLQRNAQPNMPIASIQSGGYHQVALPLQDSAKEAIKDLIEFKTTWIELAVSPSKDGIKLESTKNFSFWDRSTRLPLASTQEPRFYLAVLGDEPSSEESSNSDKDMEEEKDEDQEEEKEEEKIKEKDESDDVNETNSVRKPKPVSKVIKEPVSKQTFVILYCCPPKSPPRLRMVYSTAIGSLLTQLQETGLPVEFKIELFDDLPSSQATLQYLYARAVDCSADDGVQRLDSAPKLAKLVQTSHQQHSSKAAEDEYTSSIKPRGSQNRPAHPIFGHALPALAPTNPKLTR